ncbi:MAG: amidohydrolase [Candidatus Eisenbacteria bacterium]|uniref:Amidohydrolase n=1 Tax=Eiseniibacteriota bacterium TaxID=2212470 RepID=A0A948W5I5_UNCEI|nr:amidohydrolase [Candidatus Eisenbacteria bacterium]MBU1949371.1 amidohydrolase [Candidatus Eisenbacteria bacterium]MBU2690444.1 amidohydrolase [Candidatus Eisenbacteria bacterium]
MVRWRRTIHRHPELGLKEEKTAAYIVDELQSANLDDIKTHVGGTGVVGLLKSTNPNRKQGVLLLRADIDALPIQEENPGIDYASEIPGVMHACGHDGHTAILLATAHAAGILRDKLPGDLKFVFQPAEESPGGALPMINDGVMENPTVTGAVGLHIDTHQPVGRAQTRSGPVMAAADEFEILIMGKGGHGAYPHNTVDAVVVGSYVVTALQTLVSRNTDPNQAAVVTIGRFESGSNFNIIAETAHLWGTLRTFDPELRKTLKQRINDLSHAICQSLGAACEFIFESHYPPVVNDEGMTDLMVAAAREVLGPDGVGMDLISMGGEDMAYYLQRVPGVFLFLGAGNAERGLVEPHHSPHFNFDEEAMPLGVEIFLRFTEAFFAKNPKITS